MGMHRWCITSGRLMLAGLVLVAAGCLYDARTAVAAGASEPGGHMTIDLLNSPHGATSLPADASESGTRLRDQLDAYLRGTYRISAQRLFVAQEAKWVALDNYAASVLEHDHGYEKQAVAWRRPGKDLFSIYRKGNDAVAIGMLHDKATGGPDVIGYFELVPE